MVDEVENKSNKLHPPLTPPKVVISSKKLSVIKGKHGKVPGSKLPFPLKNPLSKRPGQHTNYSLKYMGENDNGFMGISTVRSPVPAATSSGPRSPPIRTTQSRERGAKDVKVKGNENFKRERIILSSDHHSHSKQKKITVKKYSPTEPKFDLLPIVNTPRSDIEETSHQLKDVSTLFDDLEMETAVSVGYQRLKGHKVSHSSSPLPSKPQLIRQRPQSAGYTREQGLLKSEFTTGVAANANSKRFVDDNIRSTNRPKTAGGALGRDNIAAKVSLEHAMKRNKQVKMERLSQQRLAKDVSISVPYIIHDTLRGSKIVSMHTPCTQHHQPSTASVSPRQKAVSSIINEAEVQENCVGKSEALIASDKHVKDSKYPSTSIAEMEEEVQPEIDDAQPRRVSSPFQDDNRSRGGKSIFSEGSVSIPLTSAQQIIMRSHGWEENDHRLEKENRIVSEDIDDSVLRKQGGDKEDGKETLIEQYFFPCENVHDYSQIGKEQRSKDNFRCQSKQRNRKNGCKGLEKKFVLKNVKQLQQQVLSKSSKKQPKKSNILMNPMEEAKENALNALAFFERKQRELARMDNLNQTMLQHQQHQQQQQQQQLKGAGAMAETGHEGDIDKSNSNKLKLQAAQLGLHSQVYSQDKLSVVPTSRESGEIRREARTAFKLGEPISSKMILGLPMSLPQEDEVKEKDQNTLFHLLDKSHGDLLREKQMKRIAPNKINNAFTYRGKSEPYLEYLRANSR